MDHAGVSSQPGDADADIAAGILGGGHSSRLYKTLVYDKQIAQDVSAAQQSLSLVLGVPDRRRPRVPGTRPTSSTAAIDEQLKALSTSGPDAKEVERARNMFETNLLSGLAGPRRIRRRGRHAQPATTTTSKNPGYLGDDLARASRGDGGERQDVRCRPTLKPNARVVVFGVPGDPDLGPPVPTPPAPKVAPGTGAEAVNADEAWRKDQPKPAAQRPITLPTPQSFHARRTA